MNAIARYMALRGGCESVRAQRIKATIIHKHASSIFTKIMISTKA